MKRKQLIMVDPLNNVNRLLTMQEKENGIFTICVERVDDNFSPVDDGTRKRIERPFPMRFWDKKLSEKLESGYVDRESFGHMSYTLKRSSGNFRPIENKIIASFWDTVQSAAKKMVRDNYSVSAENISPAMLKTAQEIIDEILALWKAGAPYSELNKHLVRLFMVIPRKMQNVEDFLISDKEGHDALSVLKREQELLDVVSAQVKGESITQDMEAQKDTILDALGISIRLTTEKEDAMLKKMMGDEARYFKRAFRVKNKKTHERHKKYLERHHISRKDDKLLFHGSRLQNLYGLLTQGPCLNPNAIRTGSLFGNATYFALQALKSLRYTDFRVRGVSYAGGTSSTGYLLVYNVAYKNPLHLDAHSGSGTRNFTKKSIAPHDVVHAHPGYNMGAARLVNDEIMSYDPEGGQVDIHYVIQVKC